MTIVAYRDGIMAADSAIWASDKHIICSYRKKIMRSDGGSLFGTSGSVANSLRAERHIKTCGLDFSKFKDVLPDGNFSGLLVMPNGKIFILEADMWPQPIRMKWAAIGAGSTFSMGALAAGASAEQAVRLAIKHTDCGGGPVQVERLRND